MANYTDKIGKLLRLGENASTPEEAAVYFERAQLLASANSISLEIARQHQANKEKRETPIVKNITIGTEGKKGLKYYVRLFLNIAYANDVKCDIAHNSTYVIAFGLPSDIAVVERLYASLAVQMIKASDAFIRSGKYKEEKVLVAVYERVHTYWGTERVYAGQKYKPVDGRVARASFQSSFCSRISSRLKAARAEAVKAADEARPVTQQNEETGAALVLRRKEVEVADFYKQTSEAKGAWKGARSNGYSSTGSAAGAQAADRATLDSRTAIGGSRKALG